MRTVDLPAKVFEEEGRRVEETFVETCDWLKSLNLFPRSNRYESYLALFEDFRLGRARLMDSENGLQKYINATAEATELIRIRRSLKHADSENFVRQLQKITSGRAFKNTVGADPGRDFAFELSIASRFLLAGHPVESGSLADVVAVVGRHKIYVECKRIQSPGKFIRRIGDAAKQANLRLASSPSSLSRSLVAVRVTEVLNPEARHAVLPTAEQFKVTSNTALQAFITAHEDQLKEKIQKKQLGIFLENSLHGVVYDTKKQDDVPKFINCRGAAIFYQSLGAQDEALVSSFAPGLANQEVV